MYATENLEFDLVAEVCGVQDFCIHPRVLAEVHESASRLIFSAGMAAVKTTNRALSAKTVYPDGTALALLRDQKSILVDRLSELKEQAGPYQIELLYPTLQSFTLVDNSDPGQSQSCLGATVNFSGICGATHPEAYTGSVCTLTIPPVWPVLGTSYIPINDYVMAALAFLWRVELAQKIRKTKKLLSIVIEAISTFLRSMRITPVIHFMIAVSQREFFTHHGAHPPTERSIGSSGLFVGGGFQPAAA